MRIQNNIMAMNTHRMYTSNNNAVSKSAEKLSSGYRINRAGDDAAGLAISEKMRAQVRGLNMASKNSQDAISLVQTAEGALQEVHSMLQRMNELSVQSATGTNADFDRTQISAEFDQLKNEIDQIASTTDFNGMKLLDGSLAGVGKAAAYTGAKGSAIGATTVANYAIGMHTIDFDLSKLKTGDVFTGKAAITFDADDLVDESAFVSKLNEDDNISNASLSNGKLTFTVTTAAAKFTPEATNTELQSISLTGNKDHGAGFTVSDGTNTTTFRLKVGDEPLKLASGEVAVAVNANATANDIAQALATAIGTNANNGALGANINALAVGNNVNLNGGGITTNSTVTSFRGGLEIQVGAEQGNTLNVSVDAMNSKALGLKDISIDTQAKAGDAITATRDAVNQVSDMRARLGAMQNRLDHKISNLDNTAENLQAAESRIRDVDIAKEMTTYTKNNILSQASTAMLAQANAAPQNVLSLLQ